MKKFAAIIVDISHEKVDRPFEYKIPPALQGVLSAGMRVQIPFGAGNTLRTGYVTELREAAEFPESRLKEIDSVITGAYEPEQKMIELAAWMKEQYGSTMIQALKTVLPARKKWVMSRKKRWNWPFRRKRHKLFWRSASESIR